MTTKQDVTAALKTYAEQKTGKANERRAQIDRLQNELREFYQMLNRWVYGIEGLKTEQIKAETPLRVDGEQVDWHALLINFAGTSIAFQPLLKFGEVHLAVNGLWGEAGKYLLKQKLEICEVFDETGRRSQGNFTECNLHQEIIRITKAQPIL